MRKLILLTLLISTHGFAQQVFLQLDSIKKFPSASYDSLKKYSTILVGEMHGTQEVPIIVRSLTHVFLEQGRKVILGLEIPPKNQAGIDAFLKTGNVTLLEQLPFFKNVRDGRSSHAMKELIQGCYGIQNLRIFCFDAEGCTDLADSCMAQNILKLSREPEAVLICLSGNIHANIKKGFRTGYETMGYYLKTALGSSLLSLNTFYGAGNAFNCMNGKCEARDLGEDTSQFKTYLKKEAYLLIDPGFEDYGYNGIMYLKQVNASLPLLR